MSNEQNAVNNFRQGLPAFTAEFELTEWVDDEPKTSTFTVKFINSTHQDADVYARECSVGRDFCKVVSYHAE